MYAVLPSGVTETSHGNLKDAYTPVPSVTAKVPSPANRLVIYVGPHEGVGEVVIVCEAEKVKIGVLDPELVIVCEADWDADWELDCAAAV